MSIILERNTGFVYGHRIPPSCGGIVAGGRRMEVVERKEGDLNHDSCSSSSIGKNSNVSGNGSDEGCFEESEVQSEFKGPLDTMDALEEVLPIKRGISKFYNGKSKSFTNLVDACTASSIKDFAKPENPYTRKRKSLLAHRNILERNGGYSPEDCRCNVLKKAANSCQGLSPSTQTANC